MDGKKALTTIQNTEMSVDNFEYLQTSKMNGTMNESLEYNPRLLEASINKDMANIVQSKSIEIKAELLSLNKSKLSDSGVLIILCLMNLINFLRNLLKNNLIMIKNQKL